MSRSNSLASVARDLISDTWKAVRSWPYRRATREIRLILSLSRQETSESRLRLERLQEGFLALRVRHQELLDEMEDLNKDHLEVSFIQEMRERQKDVRIESLLAEIDELDALDSQGQS